MHGEQFQNVFEYVSTRKKRLPKNMWDKLFKKMSTSCKTPLSPDIKLNTCVSLVDAAMRICPVSVTSRYLLHYGPKGKAYVVPYLYLPEMSF